MEQEEIPDLSELCRLCLDQDNSSQLFPIFSIPSFSSITVTELIHDALDINIENMKGNDILPQQICEHCLSRLEETLAFKEKSKQSQETLKGILQSMGINMDEEDEEDLLEEVEMPPYQASSSSHQATPNFSRPVVSLYPNATKTSNEKNPGKRCGEYRCDVCNQSFKYLKPFKAHMKKHPKQPKPSSMVKIKSEYPQDEPEEAAIESDDDYESNLKKSGNFFCSECNKHFRYWKPFSAHMIGQHPGVEFEAEPRETAEEDYSWNFNGIKKSGDYQCEICFQSFKYLKPFDAHMKKQHSIEYNFNSQQNYDENVNEPIAEQYQQVDDYDYASRMIDGKYQCEFCDQSYVFLKSFAHHVRKHTQVQPDFSPVVLDSRTRSKIPSNYADQMDNYEPPSPKPKIPKIIAQPKIKPEPSIRGRGRPRKRPRIQVEDMNDDPLGNVADVDEINDESDNEVYTPDFNVVDLNQVLNKSSTISDVELSNSPKKRPRSSRSPSLELVDEVDIFTS